MESIKKLVEPSHSTIVTEDDTTTDEESSPHKKDSKSKTALYDFLHFEPNDDIIQFLKEYSLFTEYNENELNKISTANDEQETTNNDMTYHIKDLLQNVRSILLKLIPTITSKLYASYTSHKDSQLAVAAASAAFQNLKREKLSETTSEIIEAEESVNTATLKTLFDTHSKEMEKKMKSTMNTMLRKKSSGSHETPVTNARQSNGTGSRKRSGDKIFNNSKSTKRPRSTSHQQTTQKKQNHSRPQQPTTRDKSGNGQNGQMRSSGRGKSNLRKTHGGRGGGQGGGRGDQRNATNKRNGPK